MSAPFDADALVESVLIRFGMDGMNVRDPMAFIVRLNAKIIALPAGQIHGFFDLYHVSFGINFFGCERTIRKRASHEVGHAIKVLARRPLPHCEDKADEVGRAYCMGRKEMARRLRTMTYSQVVDSYKSMFLENEITFRVWEVRRWMMKRTG